MKHLLLLCLLLTSLVASGQSYWEELKAPPGGAPVNITQTTNGWVYAEFYDHSVYCSQDDGLHWQQIFWPSNDPDTGFVKITVGRAGTLFAERQLGDINVNLPLRFDTYKSVDNGVTWEILLDSSNIYAVTETSDGLLFAMRDFADDSDEILRSNNGGNSWEVVRELQVSYSGWDVEIDEYDKPVVTPDFAGPLFFSVDAGQTWRFRSIDGPIEYFLITQTGTTIYFESSLLFRQPLDSLQPQIIDLNTLLDPEDAFVSSAMVLPDGDIIATTINHLYKSSDDGVTWEKLPLIGANYSFARQAPLSSGTVLANHYGHTLNRSEDELMSWAFSAYGLDKGSADVLYVQSDTAWFAMSAAGILFKTTDEGAHWTLLKGSKQGNMSNYNKVLEWDAAGNLYAIIDDTLFRSADFGQTFQQISLPDSLHPRLRGAGIDISTSSLFVSLKAGTARSTDGGATWEIVADSLYLRKMRVHPSGAFYAILYEERWVTNKFQATPYLYRSLDNGLNWEKILDQKARSFIINHLGEIYASDVVTGTRKSIDGGDSWISVSFTGRNIFVNGGNQLFAHDNSDKLFQSVDFANSWQTLPSTEGDNDLYHSFIEVSFDAQNRLYTSVWEYYGIYRLFRTTHSTLSGAYLTGSVFKDADGDCSTNDPESPLGGWVVRADGDDTWYANTDSAGRYTMFLDTGAYFLTVKPSLNVLWETCADSLPVQLPDLLDTTEQDVPVRAVADCPYMTVQLAAPWLERCFENPVFVQYCNLGTEPADSAWVDVTLDPHLVFTDTLLNYEALGNNTFRFQLGAVASGQCATFSFSVYVDCDSTILGQSLCVSAYVYPDSLCVMPPGWSGAQIQVAAYCEQDTALRFEVTNTGSATSQQLHYFVIEDDVVLMQGDESYEVDETKSFTFPANGNFRRFESEQEPGHPFSVQVAAWAEGCGGINIPGFPNWYVLNNGIPSQDAFCGETVGAFDPNDKQGFPLGYGSGRLVPPNTDIEYLVRFQNTGTAPAHNVVVRDTISGFLDPGSLRMGTASHPFTWSLSGQGFLTVTFSDINLPDSNANEAASHGFFSFKISQKPDLPNGTTVKNTASIYFDFNEAIRTNQTLHRIGRDFITVDMGKIPGAPELKIRVAPNPVTETAVLTFEGLDANEHHFRLLDVSGKILRETTFNGNALTLQREGLASGIYFFQIVDTEVKVLGGGKIILR